MPWTSFGDAVDYHERNNTSTNGIVFVVHDEDPIVGLDLDDCRDPDTGELEAWAIEILETVPTYMEIREELSFREFCRQHLKVLYGIDADDIDEKELDTLVEHVRGQLNDGLTFRQIREGGGQDPSPATEAE